MMQVKGIPTEIFEVGQSLAPFVIKSMGRRGLKDGEVLAVTSKIVSLSEKNLVKKSDVLVKADLIRREADIYIGHGAYDCHLTIKHGLLIPSAGIDESNSPNEDYILYPVDPFESARNLWKKLKSHYKIRKLGVVITDSHTTPLRRGVTGISLAHFGFSGVESLVGKKDIFGRKLKFTYINHADALAGMAVYCMGESAEKRPLALIQGANLKFNSKETRHQCAIPPHEDLYLPLLGTILKN